MESTTGIHMWRAPSIAGIPDGVLSLEPALQGAYLNSGRMSDGLARLQSTSFLFKQASERNEKAARNTAKIIARALTGMRDDMEEQLTSTQTKLDREVEGMKNRIRTELASAHDAIVRRLDGTIAAVEDALCAASSDEQTGLKEAVEFLNGCGTILQRDINSTESEYMRSMAQLVISSTWSYAMPEAIRVAQDVQGGPRSPPQYVAETGQQLEEDATERVRAASVDTQAPPSAGATESSPHPGL
ncbi:hypothetical protein A4X13_0g4457 [Tilletia indica]|uniref:Uncharacterized protein n=1 Tax=Tilletia indica TaxID=43049 RepID=A0A177TQK3_9BASI|nr:hypothetical protein A4X13_0g4457 [Tilletia indica]